MKISGHKLVIVMLIIFALCGTYLISFAENKRIHPMNQVLMSIYPRPFKMPYPHVPRISPVQALGLYKSNQAFFVHIGHDGQTIPGAINLEQTPASSIKLSILKKLALGRTIITYCN